MTNTSPMFSAFALCHLCAAVVVDEEQHQRFHEGIVKAFEDRDKAVQKGFKQHADAVRRVLRRAGLVKPEPKPQPRTPPTDVQGGMCSKCAGGLVTAGIDPQIPIRESDATVPYLVCVGCLREIRRG
ncbi:hypothetical protein [Rhodococcus sp. LW-XY12]|uniref:hypothetical protein n=1 Tax=Rhodococcus sp. LW-XY12 TaxID=2856851 RepID=UPI001C587FE1|nr:hypothetical protein [Rhodococcus sp. LW-XY12]QXU53646.1 hypothetical protein KXC42_23465 [Rhodococcus sp. LW-XY12]